MTYYMIQYFDYRPRGEALISSSLFPHIFDKLENAEAQVLKTSYVSTNGDYWGYLKEHDDIHDRYLTENDNGDYIMLDDNPRDKYVISTAKIIPVKFAKKENAQ